MFTPLRILVTAIFGLFLAAPVYAQKITVGWSAVSALNAPFWVMHDAGFLEKEGLDAKLIYIPSSSTMAQAQISGNVYISTANSQVIVDADLTGGDLAAVGQQQIDALAAIHGAAAAKADDQVDVVRRGELQAVLHVTRGGILGDAVKQERGKTGGFQDLRGSPRITRRDDSGIGNHQHSSSAELAGDFPEPFQRAGPEDDTRARLVVERLHE